jgi:hypothetical protein
MKKRIKIEIVDVEDPKLTPICDICGNQPKEEDDQYARIKIYGPNGGQVNTKYVCDLCIIALDLAYGASTEELKGHIITD